MVRESPLCRLRQSAYTLPGSKSPDTLKLEILETVIQCRVCSLNLEIPVVSHHGRSAEARAGTSALVSGCGPGSEAGTRGRHSAAGHRGLWAPPALPLGAGQERLAAPVAQLQT